MVRHHHHHRRHRPRIIIPSTTDQTLVVSASMVTGKFNTTFYNPGWSQDRIPSAELIQFLTPIEEMILPFILPRLASFVQKLVCLPILCAFIMIIGFPVSLALSKDHFQTPKIIPIGAAFFASSVLIVIIASCVLNSRRVAQRPTMLSRVQNHIAQHEPTLKAKGFYVVLPPHFPMWIEIWKTSGSNIPGQNMFFTPGVATQFYPQQQNMNTIMDINSSNIGINQSYNTSMQYNPQQQQNFGQVKLYGKCSAWSGCSNAISSAKCFLFSHLIRVSIKY